jgi:DNA/RNA endonuclease G (NUC1)
VSILGVGTLFFNEVVMCCLFRSAIRKSFRQSRVLFLASLSVLMLSLFQAEATIDASLQMQLGNPSGATADPSNQDHYLIQRTVEAMDYSDNFGEPTWVSWDLTSGDVGSTKRSTDFFTDTTLPAGFYQVTPDDYDGVGNINFDRGHMCPSEDRTDNTNDNHMVFLMSNIIPQAANNNEGVWATFENYCRTLADSGNELLITCGPSGFGSTRIPSGKAVIPDYTWKIVVVVPLGSGTALSRITAANRVIAIKIPNNNSVSSAWQNYITSASQIQIDTGYTFFTALPADVAAALRNKVDGQTNPPPIIAGFSPATGAVGDSVTITGTNFISVSSVTFNGVSAAFTVNSSTQIVATVPLNANSGPISVTAGGTAISTTSFIVTGSAADLAITSSHTGNFTQGDSADTYLISVANVGSIASSGTVTVTDLLPAGLAATSISGDGWMADLNSLTCSRSDALPAGQEYPFITVTVSVATNAPNNVTNNVSVSGGGDVNAGNDANTDPTTILTSGGTANAVTLFGWDTSGLPGGANNYGPSPYPATTVAPNLTVTGLTRGSGVGTSNSGAQRGWGGNAFTASTEAAAITANQFVTFGAVETNSAYTISYSVISTFCYRHSPTGPATAELQYQVGSGVFTNITSLSYPTNTGTGSSLGPINLSGITALQNVGGGTNVTFRIVNYGGGSGGTWYIYDVSNSPALDFVVQGVVAPVVYPPASAPSFSSLAFANNQFQFMLGGTTGSNYVVQASTNLAAPVWISVTTNAAPFVFTDTNPYPQRFYRATVAP